MDTRVIPLALYEQSPWDLIKQLKGGLSVARHPLYCDLLVGSEQNYKTAGIPSPVDIVKFNLKRLRDFWGHDAFQYVFTHARPFRFEALLDTKPWTAPATWFELAGEVWVDSEGPGLNKDLWLREVFATACSRLTMSEEEQTLFDATEELTVYRGASSRRHARYGLSWTTDREKAFLFAKRFSKNGAWLAESRVPKSYIAARFLRRDEHEVILKKVPQRTTVNKQEI